MDHANLRRIGLLVQNGQSGLEAELPITSGRIVNPLTRQAITYVRFAVVADRLIALDPPELLGTSAFHAADYKTKAELEARIGAIVEKHLISVQRLAGQLNALGIAPHIEPGSLNCRAEFSNANLTLTIGVDRSGTVRLTRALRDGDETTISSLPVIPMETFTSKAELEKHVFGLFGESPAVGDTRGNVSEEAITLESLVRAFGKGARFPARSACELSVTVDVRGKNYQFTVTRVSGALFRAVLAGVDGRVWADQISLREFPGVQSLVSRILKVPESEVGFHS